MQTKLKPPINALVLSVNAGTNQQAAAAIEAQFPNSHTVTCESLEDAVACLKASQQPFPIICLGTPEFLALGGDGRSYLRTLQNTLRELGYLEGTTKFYFFSRRERSLLEVQGH